MSRVIEVDGLTGETITREMTAEEIAQSYKDAQTGTNQYASEQARVKAMHSAREKIAQLAGLTEVEMTALGL